MAYVDLNPIRATKADTPENSDHTSIQLRIDYWKNKANQDSSNSNDTLQPESLLPFVGNLRQPMPKGLIFNLIDYIELVDWTGRIIRDDKRGAISESAPPILQRLNISTEHWSIHTMARYHITITITSLHHQDWQRIEGCSTWLLLGLKEHYGSFHLQTTRLFLPQGLLRRGD